MFWDCTTAEGGQSCFERDHQTGQVQLNRHEKQAAKMAAKKEAIGVLEMFSVVWGYQVCVHHVCFIVHSFHCTFDQGIFVIVLS